MKLSDLPPPLADAVRSVQAAGYVCRYNKATEVIFICDPNTGHNVRVVDAAQLVQDHLELERREVAAGGGAPVAAFRLPPTEKDATRALLRQAVKSTADQQRAAKAASARPAPPASAPAPGGPMTIQQYAAMYPDNALLQLQAARATARAAGQAAPAPGGKRPRPKIRMPF